LKPLVGLTQRLPLKPGDYVAEANVDGIKFATTFTVTAGEENVIVLGN
jgi:hypothetical protein